MEAPQAFARQLTRDFGGRLRVRWSVQDSAWHIEEKVGQARALAPLRIEPWRDDLIRAKDGYAFVLAVTPGDRIPCPKCRTTLHVPIRKFGETVCPVCSTLQKRTVAYRASYWPLGDGLLEHLRKIDPLTDGHRRMVKEADEANKAMEAGKEQTLRNQGEDIIRDNLNRIGGNAQVGYESANQLV